MSPLPESSSSHRKAAILLGLVAFLSFIYFYEGGGWNQNSRFDLLRAIVERHTLQIDAYHENTQDKAHFRGHYYSDKAPGLVFLAVPFALAARPVLRLMGVDPESPRGEVALSYLVSAGAVALPTALAGVCLFFLALRFGGGFERGRICDAGDVSGNSDVGVCEIVLGACNGGRLPVFAFAAALKLRDASSARGDFLWALAVGLAAGWATVTEYPAAPASAMLAFLALSQAWPQRTRGALASGGGRGFGSGDLRDRANGVSARRIWSVSSELFVLRSEFVFVYAAARVFGAYVSASGPAAEVAVWMLARDCCLPRRC